MEEELDIEDELAELDLLDDIEPDDYSGPGLEIITSIELIRYTEEMDETHVDRIVSLCYTAIRVDPKCYPAYIVLGTMEFRKGNYDTMMEHYLKGLELCDEPTKSPYTTDEVYTSLYEGMLEREGEEDYRRIAEYEERFHEKSPHYDTLRTLTYIYTNELDDPDKAVGFIRDYVERSPGEAVIIAKLAHRMLEDPDVARSILNDHLDREPDDRMAHKLLRRME